MTLNTAGLSAQSQAVALQYYLVDDTSKVSSTINFTIYICELVEPVAPADETYLIGDP
jgi:hypothetical protein